MILVNVCVISGLDLELVSLADICYFEAILDSLRAVQGASRLFVNVTC